LEIFFSWKLNVIGEELRFTVRF